MSDILMAFSIILGLYTFLFSIVSKSINKAINYKKAINREDNELRIKKTWEIFWKIQIPIFLGTLLVNVIMAPESIKIIKTFVEVISNKDIIGEYDMVLVTILFINIVFLVISFCEGRRAKA